jgi:hypothetical protein
MKAELHLTSTLLKKVLLCQWETQILSQSFIDADQA